MKPCARKGIGGQCNVSCRYRQRSLFGKSFHVSLVKINRMLETEKYRSFSSSVPAVVSEHVQASIIVLDDHSSGGYPSGSATDAVSHVDATSVKV